MLSQWSRHGNGNNKKPRNKIKKGTKENKKEWNNAEIHGNFGKPIKKKASKHPKIQKSRKKKHQTFMGFVTLVGGDPSPPLQPRRSRWPAARSKVSLGFPAQWVSFLEFRWRVGGDHHLTCMKSCGSWDKLPYQVSSSVGVLPSRVAKDHIEDDDRIPDKDESYVIA